MKKTTVLCAYYLMAFLSCHHNVEPEPEPSELIVGKWKLVSFVYFSKKEGKYKTEIQSESNYYVDEFVKNDTLFAYSASDSLFRRNCPHVYHYQIGKFQPDNFFTLPNQIMFGSDCPGNDAGQLQGLTVTNDSLIRETIDKFEYKYIRIK